MKQKTRKTVGARTSNQTRRCSSSGDLVSFRNSFRGSTVYCKLCKQTAMFLSSASLTVCMRVLQSYSMFIRSSMFTWFIHCTGICCSLCSGNFSPSSHVNVSWFPVNVMYFFIYRTYHFRLMAVYNSYWKEIKSTLFKSLITNLLLSVTK